VGFRAARPTPHGTRNVRIRRALSVPILIAEEDFADDSDAANHMIFISLLGPWKSALAAHLTLGAATYI
jgi:hypothetical protein